MNNFQSLHQSALKVATPPAEGTYEYPMIQLRGFRDQYNPAGITGCAIGFPGAKGCAFPGGGSLALPEFTGYQLQSREFRFYVPAGTKSVMFAGYAPQRELAAFAMRFGQAPIRTTSLSNEEYSATQAAERIDTSFATLVNSQADMVVVHDGGGTVRFLGGQLDRNGSSIAQGGWLYVRQLMGSELYDIQVAMDVDMLEYATGYAQIQWDNGQYPDPVEGNSTPVTNVASAIVNVYSSVSEPFKANITLHQTAPDTVANPKIDVWLAAYLNGAYFFRTSNGGWSSDMSDYDSIALVRGVNNSKAVTFPVELEFSEELLRAYGVTLHMAYRTNTGIQILANVW